MSQRVWVCFVAGRITSTEQHRCISNTEIGRHVKHEMCGWRTMSDNPEIDRDSSVETETDKETQV